MRNIEKNGMLFIKENSTSDMGNGEDICTRVMLWLPDKAIPNEIRYLQELLFENVPDNILKEECEHIL